MQASGENTRPFGAAPERYLGLSVRTKAQAFAPLTCIHRHVRCANTWSLVRTDTRH